MTQPTQERSMTLWSARAWNREELIPVRGIVGNRWCVRLVGSFIFMASLARAMDVPVLEGVYATMKYFLAWPNSEMCKSLSNWRSVSTRARGKKILLLHLRKKTGRPYDTNGQWNIENNFLFISYYQVIYSPFLRVQRMNKKFIFRLWRNSSKEKVTCFNVAQKEKLNYALSR